MSAQLSDQNGSVENNKVKDITIPYLYKPHTLTVLLGMSGIFLIASTLFRNFDDTNQNIIFGLKISALLFIVFCTLILPSGPFIRPHPLVWNIFFGASIVYFVFMAFLSFQTPEDAKRIINIFDPISGKHIELKAYAENCEFTLENLWENINDRFFVSHLLGWVAKSLVFRNRLVCWSMSIFWELLEYSLIFIFPNFAECWWDSLILDILLANAIGIEIGLFTCRFFEMKEYKWSGILEIKPIWGKLKRVILQFSPESWAQIDWHPFSTIKRFLCVNLVAFGFLAVDVNTFTLKACLNIPPESNLNVYRLVLWFGLGFPSMRQAYCYMTDPHCERFGSMATLSLLIILVESFVSIKFSLGEIPVIPRQSYLLWSLYLTGYFVICLILSLRIRKEKVKKDK